MSYTNFYRLLPEGPLILLSAEPYAIKSENENRIDARKELHRRGYVHMYRYWIEADEHVVINKLRKSPIHKFSRWTLVPIYDLSKPGYDLFFKMEQDYIMAKMILG